MDKAGDSCLAQCLCPSMWLRRGVIFILSLFTLSRFIRSVGCVGIFGSHGVSRRQNRGLSSKPCQVDSSSQS